MLSHKVYLFVCLYIYFVKRSFVLLSTHVKLVNNITSCLG